MRNTDLAVPHGPYDKLGDNLAPIYSRAWSHLVLKPSSSTIGHHLTASEVVWAAFRVLHSTA